MNESSLQAIFELNYAILPVILFGCLDWLVEHEKGRGGDTPPFGAWRSSHGKRTIDIGDVGMRERATKGCMDCQTIGTA
jgi:hypothetical protein